MNLSVTESIALWKEEYLTGNAQIDSQHHMIFAIVNCLHRAICDRQPNYRITELLEYLADHTIEHFQTEESLMMAVNYPEYPQHKQTHDLLLAKVHNILRKCNNRLANLSSIQANSEATTEITHFLYEWLAHHIKGEDQKMIMFFQYSDAASSVSEIFK
ncbi:MAG: bacteriohemerythrin [Pseudanabaenaceae cyanobacterium bins.39]|nr:bacteriohemerythrin [Pseudanabaenaceae cyanobacterium bins.39]